MPNKAAKMYSVPETNPASSRGSGGGKAAKQVSGAQVVPVEKVKPHKNRKTKSQGKPS